MTDPTRDPIDDRMRAALRGLALPETPESLRHTLESIPERSAGRPPSRRWSPGLAIAAVVVVAVLGVAGLLGLTRIPATPGSTAAPAAPTPAPAEPPASVSVLGATQLKAAIEAQRAGGLAPQWVVTAMGIDASRMPDALTRECSPQGSCAVIGVLHGFEDPAGTVTIRIGEREVPPVTTAADLAGPVALRLSGIAPIEFLGHVDLASGDGVLGVPELLSATDTAAAGRVVVVNGWLVGVDAFPSCGPATVPALVPPFECPPNRSLLTAEPVKPVVAELIPSGGQAPAPVLGNSFSLSFPPGAVQVQWGGYADFAPDPASDGTNNEPRQGLYLVRLTAVDTASCPVCRGWLMVGRLDAPGAATPPATTAPTSSITLRSPQELESLLAADRAAWIGRPVFVDGAIDPGFPDGCAPDAAACGLGTLTGTAERVVATGYTASLLLPDTNYPIQGPMALVVRESGLQYLGWLGWSDPLGYETTVEDLVNLASKPRGPMITTVKGWLVAGLPTPCPAPPERLGEDTPFDACPPAWLTRDEVQPATSSGGSTIVSEPAAGVRVQYSAYGAFAPDPLIDPATGLTSPRYGTYVVRLVTDARTGDADTGTKGWQVVGRLDPDPELGPPDDPGPAPTTEPPPAPPSAEPSPAATVRPRPSGAPEGLGPADRFETATLDTDGRTLTIGFVGGKPYRAGDPCSTAYEGWAQVAGDTLYAAVIDVTPSPPDGATPPACLAMGYGRTVTVTLPEPFTGFRVEDLAGYVHFLRAPDHLAVLPALPDGWQLTTQGDVGESPTGRWVRTWARSGVTDAGPGRLDLYQAFGGPADVTGGEDTSTVTVNGADAMLYRHAPTGELVLVWSLGGDGLALVAYEADFTEAELVRLAESVVPGP